MGVLKMVIGTEIWPSLNEWENKLLFLETGEIILNQKKFATS